MASFHLKLSLFFIICTITNKSHTIYCPFDGKCSDQTLVCPDNEDCIVNCYDCTRSIIYCPKTAHQCYVNCSNEKSCESLVIDASLSIALHVTATGYSEIFESGLIKCPHKHGICNIFCEGTHSCKEVTIDGRDTYDTNISLISHGFGAFSIGLIYGSSHGTLSVECVGEESCVGPGAIKADIDTLQMDITATGSSVLANRNIYCPNSNTEDGHKACNIILNGEEGMLDTSIYATESFDDINFVCDPSFDDGCNGITIFCGHDYSASCAMVMSNANKINKWKCESSSDIHICSTISVDYIENELELFSTVFNMEKVATNSATLISNSETTTSVFVRPTTVFYVSLLNDDDTFAVIVFVFGIILFVCTVIIVVICIRNCRKDIQRNKESMVVDVIRNKEKRNALQQTYSIATYTNTTMNANPLCSMKKRDIEIKYSDDKVSDVAGSQSISQILSPSIESQYCMNHYTNDEFEVIGYDRTPDDETPQYVQNVCDKQRMDALSVKQWLTYNVGLVQYYPHFMHNGYDALGVIKEIESRESLLEIGVFADQHIAMLLDEIRKLKHEHHRRMCSTDTNTTNHEGVICTERDEGYIEIVEGDNNNEGDEKTLPK